MRLHYVSLLVAGAFFRSAKANSALIGSTPTTASSVDSLTAEKDDVFVLRFLRTTIAVDEDDKDGEQSTIAQKTDEERAFSFDFRASIDALKSKVQTLLLRMFDSKAVEKAFEKHGLMEAGESLLELKEFNEWLEETKKLRPLNFNDEAVSTLLRYYKDDVLYKILDAKNTEEVVADLQNALIKSWLTKKKSPIDVFTIVEQDSKLDDILTSPSLPIWTKYLDDYNKANRGFEMNEFEVLVRNYDEKYVFKMLEAAKKVDSTEELAKKVDSTEELATKLQEQQMKYWKEMKYSPDEVFGIMEHDSKLDDILTSPYWPVWTKYLDDYNKANRRFKMNEFKVLVRNYDEKYVFKMLEAAKKVDSTKELATKLERQQMKYWENMKYRPERIYKIITYESELDDIVTSPSLLFWIDYLADFNKGINGYDIEAYEVLVRKYGENKVCTVLEMAKKIDGMEELVTKLQEQQLKYWKEEKYSPDEVFEIMEQDSKLDDILSSPYLPVWTKYLDDYNKANRGFEMNEFEVLVDNYDEKDVIKMLEAAKNIDSTKELATKLQEQQMKYLKEKYGPDEVVEIMKHDSEVDDILTGPFLPVWTKRLDDYNKANHDFKMNEFEVLRYSLGDKDVFAMLDAAKKVDGTKELATKLEEQQMKHWAKRKYKPDQVFQIMLGGYNRKDRLIMWEKYFPVWMKYVDNFNKKSIRRKIQAFDVLRRNMDEGSLFRVFQSLKMDFAMKKVVTTWQEKMIQQWRDSYLDPDEVFKTLELGSKPDDILTSPNLLVWMKYLADYNKINPDRQMDAYEVLVKCFDEKEVFKMLEAAKESESEGMKTLGSKLEKQEINYFVKKKYDADEFFEIVNQGHNMEEILTNWKKNFPVWIQYVNLFNEKNKGDKIQAFDMLRKHHNDHTLFMIFQSAKMDSATKEVAKIGQEQLIKSWLKFGVSPIQVFKIVEQDSKLDDILTSPSLPVWTKYLDDYNKGNIGHKMNEFEVLVRCYGETAVSEMLKAMKKVGSTNELVAKLQKQQTK